MPAQRELNRESSVEGQTRTHTTPECGVWGPRREEVKQQLGPNVPGCSEDSPRVGLPLQGALGPPRHSRPGAQRLGVGSRRHGPPRAVSFHDRGELPG